MAVVQSLTDLPDSCLLDVLKSCEGLDLLKFQQASRRLCGLAKAPVIWRDALMREFQLDLPKACPYSWIQKIFRCMQESKGSALGYLDYWGMLTDGGLDDNSPFYWVDNMFSSRADHYYCSQMFKSSDIRCIAVQNPIPSRPRRGECIKAVKATVNTNSVRSEKHRSRPDWELNSLSNGATGVASDLPSNHELLVDEESLGLMRKQSHIAMQEIVVNRGVRIGRMGGLTCPVSSGVIMLGNYDLSTASGSNMDVSSQLYGKSFSRQSNQLNKLKDLEAVLSACQSKKIVLPLVVCFGNSGEWVEFESGPGNCLTGESLHIGNNKDSSSTRTCTESAQEMQPVVWFRFYRKGEEIWNSSRRDHLSAEFAALGVKCKRVTEQVQPTCCDDMLVDEEEYPIHDWFGPQLSDPSFHTLSTLASTSSLASSSSSSSSSDGFDSALTAVLDAQSPGPSSPLDLDMGGDLLGASYNIAMGGSSESMPSISPSSSSGWSRSEASTSEDGKGFAGAYRSCSDFGDIVFGANQVPFPPSASQAEFPVSHASDATGSSFPNQIHEPVPGAHASSYSDLVSWSEEDGSDTDSALLNSLPDFEWVDYSDIQSVQSDELESQQFRISTPVGNHTYWSTRSMHNRELMDIVFHKPVIGNALCVMLNNCENLMDDMHDMHEGPNVDINFVWMIGEKVAVESVDCTR